LLALTVLVLALTAGVLLAGLATPADAAPVARANTTVELLAEGPAVPGKPMDVAFRLVPRAGWHTYWLNPGDAGEPAHLAWTLPRGWQAGPLRYPAPVRLPFGGLMTYGFEGPVTLLATLTPPAGFTGVATLRAEASWLVCDDKLCVPEDAPVALTVDAGGPAAGPATATLFAAARAALPLDVDWPARFNQRETRFILELGGAAARMIARDAWLFPEDDGAIAYEAAQHAEVARGVLRLTTTAGPAMPATRLAGVLTFADASGARRAVRITASRDGALALLPAPAPGARDGTGQVSGPGLAAPAAGGAPGGASGMASGAAALRATGTAQAATLAQGQPPPPASLTTPFLPAVLLAALAGGLLLNLMPCVLPVLALKALSLAGGSLDPAHARRSGLAYTAGVLAAFALIGLMLLVLRGAGQGVGWGFQLQSPLMVATLALLMTAVALNLWGVFALGGLGTGLGQALVDRGGMAGSFWTGALAVLVATPCTAPFMATALGATLVLPPAAALLVFLALGLGLALPYLAISLWPALGRVLPRPGPWMEPFRALLGFPMAATALWLFWVLGRLTDTHGMAVGLAAALLMACALWLVGRGQKQADPAGDGAGWRGATAAVLLLAVPLALVWLLDVPRPGAGGPAPGPASAGAAPFSAQQLARARATGRPVFVYFTADWCITCKLNEATSIRSDAVASAFAGAGVQVLEADWTRRDPEIGAVLRGFGRSGVPLYLYYRAGARTADILPQILTPAMLVGLVRPA